MNYSATTTSTIYISFVAPAPTCSKCASHGPNLRRTNHPQFPMLCASCFQMVVRENAIVHAQTWIEQAFLAVGVDGRKKLHRALSQAFHPDQGGDEKLMIALNAVRERYPS